MGETLKTETGFSWGLEVVRAKSNDLGGDVSAAEDFVFVCDCAYGEAADGSAEGSVSDASVKHEW